MAMGIDQEIQRRMDAYRGNPQALQQRYQMNQQLLDLLALQKLKSEKDVVARQMQAQMQQMPGTVAQQREQEMLGRTKQEMAQQVGGVMQQRARQQQQNMARMAQAAARPQGGIAGLAPQGARMAGGGIVPSNFTDLIRDPETGKLIPKEAYDQKYPEPEKSLLDRLKDSAQEFMYRMETNPLEERYWEARGNLSREEREEILKRLAEKQDARMAGGGIVAFAQGGDLNDSPYNLRRDPFLRELGLFSKKPAPSGPLLTDREIGLASNEELMQAASEGRISEEAARQEIQARVGRTPLERAGEFLGKVDTRAEELLTRKIPEAAGDIGSAITGYGAAERGVASIPGAIGRTAQRAYEYLTTPTKESVPPTPPIVTAPSGTETGAAEAGDVVGTAGTAGAGAGAGAVDPQDEIVAIEPQPGLTLDRVTAPQVGEAPSAAGLRSLLQAQAGEAAPDMTNLMEQYGSALGQKERMARRQARIDELAALDRTQLDPERARKDRLLRTMAAAGGASNIGTMGARMANASINARINQEQDERARLRQRLAMADEMDVADLDISKESLKNALGTIDNAKARRIQAMNALGTLSQAEVARLEANAKLEAEADRENNTSAYREYEAATERAKAVLARQDAGVDQLTAVAKQLFAAYETKHEQLMTQLQSDARYIELINDAERTEAEDQELLEMVNGVERDAAAYANMKDYFAIMDQLNNRALQNAGISLNSGR